MPRRPALAAVLLLAACARPAELRVEDGVVDLSRALEHDWDRVCILEPYTTNRLAREVTGVDVNVEWRSDIVWSDSITLLVTLHGDRVSRLVEVSRGNVDFAPVGGACYRRDAARFAVARAGHARAEWLR